MAKDVVNRKKMLSLIDKWVHGEMTQKAFCAKHKIKYYLFHYWYKVYKNEHAVAAKTSTFVPINFDTTSGTYAELVMPNGKRLLFHQPADLNTLIQLLQ